MFSGVRGYQQSEGSECIQPRNSVRLKGPSPFGRAFLFLFSGSRVKGASVFLPVTPNPTK